MLKAVWLGAALLGCAWLAAAAPQDQGKTTPATNPGETKLKSEPAKEGAQEGASVPQKSAGERFSADEPAPAAGTKSLSEAERQALRRGQQSEEEAAELPYLNNFFKDYRLGPEDVITVDVFGQATYSRENLPVGPDGRISYPLIGQVRCVGRTAPDLEREITEKLAEYIIDPKVSVRLVQAHSAKIIVEGDVATPGIIEMTRRMTVTEAIARAGGVTRTGSKTNIRVLRMRQSGERDLLAFNLKEFEKGKNTEIFLVPGDVVVVPGSKFSSVERVVQSVSLVGWMRMIAR